MKSFVIDLSGTLSIIRFADPKTDHPANLRIQLHKLGDVFCSK